MEELLKKEKKKKTWAEERERERKVSTGLEDVTWRWTAGQWVKRRVKSDNWHVPFKRILRFVYLATRFLRPRMYFRIGVPAHCLRPRSKRELVTMTRFVSNCNSADERCVIFYDRCVKELIRISRLLFKYEHYTISELIHVLLHPFVILNFPFQLRKFLS